MQNKIYNKKLEFDRILDKQRYPIEANEELEVIAAGALNNGFFEAIIKAFNLGLIYGKRMERNKRL